MRARIAEDVLDFDVYHRQYSVRRDHVATVENYRGWHEEAGFETLCRDSCFNRALIIARLIPARCPVHGAACQATGVGSTMT